MTSSYGDSKTQTYQMSHYLKSSSFKSFSDLCDVASVLFLCTVDSTIMLVVEPNTNEYWIPTVKLHGEKPWVDQTTKNLSQEVFGTVVPLTKLIRLNKLWVPSHKSPYVTHSVFEAQVNMDLKKKSKTPFGKYKGKVRWSTFEEVIKFNDNHFLRSSEILEYVGWSLNQKTNLNPPAEYLSIGNYTELTNEVLVTTRKNLFEQIVEAAGIDRLAQETLYKEFLVMTYPCIYLNQTIFSKFLTELGWTREELPHLFRSADIHDRNSISFREFLYFVSTSDHSTVHGGGPGELRCRYIFRYLDVDKNNLLKRDEIKRFVFLSRKARRQNLDPTAVEQELVECYKTLGIDQTYALSLQEFLRFVSELKIRGTSQIFRAPTSITKLLKELAERERRMSIVTTHDYSFVPATLEKTGTYELAVHSINIYKDGTTIQVEPFWNIENSASETGVPKSLMNSPNRKISADIFDQNSKTNELLRSIRQLIHLNKNSPSYLKIETLTYIWGTFDPSTIAKHFFTICNDVKEIFKKEPRLIEISSPVYILGDLHGNMTDLLHFEKLFWQIGPGLCPGHILFLGDYVDRGIFGFEVVCYLFSYKLQNPKKVYLLRGNHEIRRIQMQWTFEKECKIKFGEKLGSFLFNNVNEVFDSLPLAAVIDDSIFCCHGGIPPPWLCPVVAAINDIPKVLPDPQDQSSLAWELMWNDPIRSKTISDKVVMELLANEGFAINSRRGTAHFFSVEALERFLAVNGFTHLVRAHEVADAGFFMQQKGRSVTVFSSGKYCGSQNVAACLFADQGKIRILRFHVDEGH